MVLARVFIKQVKIFNDKVDVEFLEFPELAHQEPVQILKELSIRRATSSYQNHQIPFRENYNLNL